MRGLFRFWTLWLLCFAACTDERRSAHVLEGAGFDQIEFTGYQHFDCSGERFKTGFVARNATGQRVEGTVCCGWLGKNCTIRFE